MIKNLITACLLACANVTTPNITKEKQPLNTQQVETREVIYSIDQVAEDTRQSPIYYYGGKQHQHLQYYDIDTVWLNYPTIQDEDFPHFYISFYMVITPLTEDRPTQAINLLNSFTATGEIEGTISVRRAYQYNRANKDAEYLDLENVVEEQYDDLMQDSTWTYGQWTQTRVNYNYFLENIDRTETITATDPMNDGKIRYSCLYEITFDETAFNVRPETSTFTYYYYVQPIEVVDIPGIMWQILGMPFSFISQAFNLTIFPGTPYQINISNLIFTVISALIIIVVIKKVLK